MAKIDKKDKRILAALDMNARMPFTELARRVGLSRQVVEYRIKKMQKAGIIFGALGIFDSAVVGFNWYRVALRLLKVTRNQKDEIIAYLKNNKYTFWIGEVGGNWDLVVNFICKDNFEFNSIFEAIISRHGSSILTYEILIYIDVHDYQRSYILQNKKEREEFYHKMKYDSGTVLDALDKKIIAALSKNAFVTNVELGQQFKVAGNTIKNRIYQLIKNKILLGFRIFINPALLGYQSHMLFLGIRCMDLQKEKELYTFLKTIQNITFVVKHIGRWRIGMEIETKDLQEFQDIFVNIRSRFIDIISDYESFPLFKDHTINYFPEGNLS